MKKQWRLLVSAFFTCTVALFSIAMVDFSISMVQLSVAQDKPPQLSAESRVAILQVQLHQKDLESRFMQAQQAMTAIQAEFTQTQTGLQAAIDAAYKDAKLDKKDWNLDLAKLEFTKVPTPPKPETKKP